MLITETIDGDLMEAVKARDTEKATIMRTIKAQLKNAAIEARRELDDKQVVEVMRKEAKKRKEAMELYQKSSRQDLADKEKKELEIIEKYLPAGIKPEELSAIIDKAIAETGAKTMADMGKVMGAVNAVTQGRADGAEIAAQVKTKLGA